MCKEGHRVFQGWTLANAFNVELEKWYHMVFQLNILWTMCVQNNCCFRSCILFILFFSHVQLWVRGTALKNPASFLFCLLYYVVQELENLIQPTMPPLNLSDPLFKIKFQQRDWSNSNLWLFCWTTQKFSFFNIYFLFIILSLLLASSDASFGINNFFLFIFQNFYLITISFYLRGNRFSYFVCLCVKSISNQTSCLPNPWSYIVPTIVIAWLVHKKILFPFYFWYNSLDYTLLTFLRTTTTTTTWTVWTFNNLFPIYCYQFNFIVVTAIWIINFQLLLIFIFIFNWKSNNFRCKNKKANENCLENRLCL